MRDAIVERSWACSAADATFHDFTTSPNRSSSINAWSSSASIDAILELCCSCSAADVSVKLLRDCIPTT
ncbi:hypothetical protein ACHAXA_006553 [Cyclostephanos tholiformis]|uniref:Uncharacterized protein n=1 Tax=Cyclostephanos tholiformis TaxID=382380 RepID=A0ABD3RKE6_9STRA